MAESAVHRLRGILARDMTAAEINTLIAYLTAELAPAPTVTSLVASYDRDRARAEGRAQAAADLRLDARLRAAEGLHEIAEHWNDAADYLSPPEAADA